MSKILSSALVLSITLSSAMHVVHSAEENRYRDWIDAANVLHRFDRVSGDIEMLVKPSSGPAMWVRCEVVQQSKPQAPRAVPQPRIDLPAAPSIAVAAAPAPVPQRQAAILDPVVETTQASLSPEIRPRSTSARAPIFVDEKGNDITDEINDADRTECRTKIAGYERNMSLFNTIKLGGDRITGVLNMENKGERRIKVLELTMFVRIVGKDGLVPHARFIFNSKPGGEKPPQPGTGAVLQKVDLPTPSGVVSGMPDMKITFIKFED